jgi:hypothetical protein
MGSWITYRCNSATCDFQVCVGHFEQAPGIQVFCVACFNHLYLKEVHDKTDPDFMADVRVLRILKADLPDRPAKLTPKERRMARQAGQTPPPRKVEWGSQRPTFVPTGDYVFWPSHGGPPIDIESGPCPHCGTKGTISIGFDGDDCVCPKCRIGTIVIHYEWC